MSALQMKFEKLWGENMRIGVLEEGSHQGVACFAPWNVTLIAILFLLLPPMLCITLILALR